MAGAEIVPAERISDFVAEGENPENIKQVERVRVELPSMDRYRGIRFVDMPGRESVFEHNTEASVLAPECRAGSGRGGRRSSPLSQRHWNSSVACGSYRHISILLTKVDVLDEHERSEVREFIETQLARHGSQSVPVFPFSAFPVLKASAKSWTRSFCSGRALP